MNYTATDEPEATTADTGPDEGTMIALLKVAGRVQARLESALEAAGLSPAKYQALDALVRAGQPLALSELAGCLNCVRSNVTQLADRLETDGLIRRVDDPFDRRAIRAVVTPLGTERHTAGKAVIENLQHAFAQRISAADRQAFRRVLSTLES